MAKTAFSKSSASQQAKSRAGVAPGQRKSNSGEPVAANTQSESYFAARLADQARAQSTAAPIGIAELCKSLEEYLDDDQIRKVARAHAYAKVAHDGQFRRTGHAYISHPLAVANILAGMRMDHQTIMAALLHDVIEDTQIARPSRIDSASRWQRSSTASRSYRRFSDHATKPRRRTFRRWPWPWPRTSA